MPKLFEQNKIHTIDYVVVMGGSMWYKKSGQTMKLLRFIPNDCQLLEVSEIV